MPLPNRVRWTRDQLLIVLNLYHKLPFGKISLRQTENESTEVIPDRDRPLGAPISPSPAGGYSSSLHPHRPAGRTIGRAEAVQPYPNRCALTGLPIRELLIASHILPWSGYEAERLNVRNGIALNRLHDAAFDQGLIAFDDDLRLLLSSHLKSRLAHESVKSSFEAFEGKPLDLPTDGIPPTTAFLAKHRLRFEFS